MTNDCKTCPVSTGTHKPAEALHQQIAEPQPTALGYADAISAGLSYTAPHILALAADELRAQHARIAELESQLEAIGAGGVEPLRTPVAAPQAVQAAVPVDKSPEMQDSAVDKSPVLQDSPVAPAHPAEGVPAQAVQPQQAMEALKAAMKADPEYAWSWHCAIWSGAHDEGLETGAANRAAARVMHMAFDCDTTKNANFHAAHLAANQPAAQGMEQDAARYRYLRETDRYFSDDKDGAIYVRQVGITSGVITGSTILTDEELDAAIDTALAAEAKQGGAANG